MAPLCGLPWRFEGGESIPSVIINEVLEAMKGLSCEKMFWGFSFLLFSLCKGVVRGHRKYILFEHVEQLTFNPA